MHDQELSRYRSLDEMITDIRGLGNESDGALRALLNVAPLDESAVAAVIVALLPLALSRCAGSRDRVDDLISELAIVIGEVAAAGLPPSSRRVANVLLDRAWGRVRRPARRTREPSVADPIELGWRLVDPAPDPADLAVGRVALDGLVWSMTTAAASHASTVRAWNTAVSLAEVDERSASDRIRLKYARKVLRRSLPADLVA